MLPQLEQAMLVGLSHFSPVDLFSSVGLEKQEVQHALLLLLNVPVSGLLS